LPVSEGGRRLSLRFQAARLKALATLVQAVLVGARGLIQSIATQKDEEPLQPLNPFQPRLVLFRDRKFLVPVSPAWQRLQL